MAMTNKSLLAQYAAAVRAIEHLADESVCVSEDEIEVEWTLDIMDSFTSMKDILGKEIVRRGLEIPVVEPDEKITDLGLQSELD